MNNKYAVKFQDRALSGPIYEKQIAWPMYAWQVFLPEKVSSNLDILQRFVLSIAEIDSLESTNIFKEIGLSTDLKQVVIQSCIDKGYLHENQLTEEGKEQLNPKAKLSSSKSERYKQLYLFVDAVNGDLVPHFSVERIPQAYEVPFSFVLPYQKKNERKPKIFEVESALKKSKEWRHKVNELLKISGQETIVPDEIENDDSFFGDFEDFSFEDEEPTIFEEGRIQKVNVTELAVDDMLQELEGEQQFDGTFEQQRSFEDEQSDESLNAQMPNLNERLLQFRSEKPQLLYVPVTLYGHADTFLYKTNVLSPFSQYEDSWFNNAFAFINSTNEEMQQFLEQFKQEMQQQFKSRYPFTNTLKIELFNDFPLIANDEKWQELRKQIEVAEIAFLRIEKGDEDFDNYYMRVQRMLELVFYLVFKQQELAAPLKAVGRENYKQTLMNIQADLSITIPKNYFNLTMWQKIDSSIQRKINFSSSKDAALLYVLNAYFSKNTDQIEVLRQLPSLLSDIAEIVDVRNREAHYSANDINHQQMYKKIRQTSNDILRLMISHILLGNERVQ